MFGAVGKSFVSALFGIALDEGKIRSIEDKVTDYCPAFKGKMDSPVLCLYFECAFDG
jgi:CubicO group peptidase (beta-lactamase class C family)